MNKSNDVVIKTKLKVFNGVKSPIQSQRLVRCDHCAIASKLSKELNINPKNILFEAKVGEKNVDLVIVNDDNIPIHTISIRSQYKSIKNNLKTNSENLANEAKNIKQKYVGVKTHLVYYFNLSDITTGIDMRKHYKDHLYKKYNNIITSNNNYDIDKYDSIAFIFVNFKKQQKIYYYEDFNDNIIDYWTLDDLINNIKNDKPANSKELDEILFKFYISENEGNYKRVDNNLVYDVDDFLSFKKTKLSTPITKKQHTLYDLLNSYKKKFDFIYGDEYKENQNLRLVDDKMVKIKEIPSIF